MKKLLQTTWLNLASQISAKKVLLFSLLVILLMAFFLSSHSYPKPLDYSQRLTILEQIDSPDYLVPVPTLVPMPSPTATPSATPNIVPKKKVALPAKSVELGDNQALVSYYDRSACQGNRQYGKNCGTAGGQIFNENAMTVAHKSLRFGTRIEFRYGKNIVECVVNDRGPYIRGREFDLSKGCAEALGMRGLAVVFYRIIQ